MMEGCQSSFGIQVTLVLNVLKPLRSKVHITHSNFSVVAFKEIRSRLTVFRPRRVATNLKRYYRLH
jgi:hypothetical protein